MVRVLVVRDTHRCRTCHNCCLLQSSFHKRSSSRRPSVPGSCCSNRPNDEVEAKGGNVRRERRERGKELYSSTFSCYSWGFWRALGGRSDEPGTESDDGTLRRRKTQNTHTSLRFRPAGRCCGGTCCIARLSGRRVEKTKRIKF